MDILHTIFAGNYIVPFFVAITILIFFHELGHYAAARQCGIEVQVFSIGIGPRIFGRRDRHGTMWQLAALPIGGYVKMRGQNDIGNEESPDDNPGSFVGKSLLKRSWVVFAGPFANFLLAFLLIYGLYVSFGQFTPSEDGDWVVIQISSDSPSEKAGIIPNDQIVSIDGKTISTFDDLVTAVQQSEGSLLRIGIARAGGVKQVSVAPVEVITDSGEKTWRIGLAARQIAFVPLGPIEGIFAAARVLYDLVGLTLTAIGEIIIGERSTNELGGPVRIAELSTNFAQQGVYGFVIFLAALSLNLGIINLFPLPVLDGGHLLLYGIEAARGKPLSIRAQIIFWRIGIVLLLSFALFVTYQDILRLL